MTEIGRLYVKIAGREAGKFCTVVEVMDPPFVMIDGQVRRKKCNLSHLEPLEKKMDLKKGASHADVVKAFEKMGIKVVATKPKTKKNAKPQAQRKQKKPKAESEDKTGKAREKKEKGASKENPAKKEAKK